VSRKLGAIQSGQKIPVEEKIKPVFRAGRELKKRINEG
jgi:nucleoid DNA-binding protein